MNKTLSLGAIFTAVTMYAGLPTISYASNDLSAPIPIVSENQNEAGYVALSKISIQQAIQTALDKVSNGKILKAELENENGRLVCGIEVVNSNSGTMDVKVDAGNGKVLKIEKDNNDKEYAESQDNKEIENRKVPEEASSENDD